MIPYVSHGYLETLGIPLRSGRWFTDRDAPRAPPVAVISEGLARREFPGENPIGQRIRYGRPLEIVGVVGDVKYRGLQRDDEPTFYQLASQQAQLWDLWLMIRMNSGAQGQIAACDRRFARWIRTSRWTASGRWLTRCPNPCRCLDSVRS